jgi:galactokinase
MTRHLLLKEFITRQFIDQFGIPASYLIQAPGRVNLIGEHTDYNDGFVLPCAIDFQTMVAVEPREDQMVCVVASDYHNQKDLFDLNSHIEKNQTYQWANYIRGVFNCFKNIGYPLKGANLVVAGNIPQGAGLSSSAALEVAIGQAIKSYCKIDISQQDIALIGQQTENEFVGCHCGIMDQLISAKGEADHAMLLDCRSLESRAVKIPASMSIIIINSNVKRKLLDSEYNARRKQCEQAANYFSVQALRDISLETLTQLGSRLDYEVTKRARHVISENDRTLSAEKALNNQDMKTLADLMAESHQSMKNDFEITVPQIDYLVEIVKEVTKEQGGVRMTGGGFGGCVVALVPTSLNEAVIRTIERQYSSKTGLTADIFICKAMRGASEIG